jgi:hypothetical protein
MSEQSKHHELKNIIMSGKNMSERKAYASNYITIFEGAEGVKQDMSTDQDMKKVTYGTERFT